MRSPGRGFLRSSPKSSRFSNATVAESYAKLFCWLMVTYFFLASRFVAKRAVRDKILFKSLFEKWRRASRPAVEGGILPPGKTTRKSATRQLYRAFLDGTLFPPGWKPGSTSAKMADATDFEQALRKFKLSTRRASVSFGTSTQEIGTRKVGIKVAIIRIQK